MYLEPEYQLDLRMIEDMIKECDKNGDGVIDYAEFKEMMSKSQWLMHLMNSIIRDIINLTY